MRTLLAFILIFSFTACSDSDVQKNGGGPSDSEVQTTEGPPPDSESPKKADIQTQEIDYTAGDTTLKGYLAWDKAVTGKRPGILVVHEWWGHNEHARERARMLAKLGYTALAVDMYGDGQTADHPKKAGELMSAAMKDWEGSMARFRAAKKVLQDHETVDPEKIASIGFCFGGTVSLRMARAGEDLDAVVAFHAGLPEDSAAPGSVKAAVLVINGSEDVWLDPKVVAKFQKEMKEATVDFTYITLPGVKHAYTNKQADEMSRKFDIPNLQYNQEADQKAWTTMEFLFKRVFAK
ncbi:MAG: dienelactone hydrolase family protein [Nitrospinaceae bacterium]|nr:dienelactone hydrolase family protein [Nitrospinaceae bacterium]NIR54195.1 dienelactone hydrolase family protein [Nitrospinaceae bacterium]NIS84610.1 dienelactone hydrolase family protein [Nitrospinaceae bacterium]NIT81405.1 dienelactone hydrolase family protein [Nitrospinaceae bacterium]NIU43689.1 dienelactone hydrolase family protein [Nitrospinaceae bacterium]